MLIENLSQANQSYIKRLNQRKHNNTAVNAPKSKVELNSAQIAEVSKTVNKINVNTIAKAGASVAAAVLMLFGGKKIISLKNAEKLPLKPTEYVVQIGEKSKKLFKLSKKFAGKKFKLVQKRLLAPEIVGYLPAPKETAQTLDNASKTAQEVLDKITEPGKKAAPTKKIKSIKDAKINIKALKTKRLKHSTLKLKPDSIVDLKPRKELPLSQEENIYYPAKPVRLNYQDLNGKTKKPNKLVTFFNKIKEERASRAIEKQEGPYGEHSRPTRRAIERPAEELAPVPRRTQRKGVVAITQPAEKLPNKYEIEAKTRANLEAVSQDNTIQEPIRKRRGDRYLANVPVDEAIQNDEVIPTPTPRVRRSDKYPSRPPIDETVQKGETIAKPTARTRRSDKYLKEAVAIEETKAKVEEPAVKLIQRPTIESSDASIDKKNICFKKGIAYVDEFVDGTKAVFSGTAKAKLDDGSTVILEYERGKIVRSTKLDKNNALIFKKKYKSARNVKLNGATYNQTQIDINASGVESQTVINKRTVNKRQTLNGSVSFYDVKSEPVELLDAKKGSDLEIVSQAKVEKKRVDYSKDASVTYELGENGSNLSIQTTNQKVGNITLSLPSYSGFDEVSAITEHFPLEDGTTAEITRLQANMRNEHLNALIEALQGKKAPKKS